MTRTGKTGEPWSGLFRVGVVGAASLKGKEVKDVLSERSFPAEDVKLLDDEESLGQVEAVGDEPTFIQQVTPEQLEDMDFTFFCSDEAYTAKTWRLARTAGSEIIDLSYALDGEKGAALRAPLVERELGLRPKVGLETAPVVVAHPASAVLALLLARVQKVRDIRSSVATVCEPASEYGKRGMDELHDQTVNLLSFQQMPMNVFGTQVAFNLGSGYGENIKPSMPATELRILNHYSRITNGKLPLPSLMLLHAPVFHAHTFSIYIELASPFDQNELQAALSGEHVQITHSQDEEPSNVNVAGAEDILVSVRPDVQRDTGVWLWAAADNLRVSATMAVNCAEEMVATRPRGQVQ
ncbi:MAG TPA: Asd/ArgC dimerization domain-containing protein [Terriglobales bacterium]|nr:Asd/ArgC dimerization domain-containing protein [Terriglobales bacterium]